MLFVRSLYALVAVIILSVSNAGDAYSASTIDQVRSRGFVRCGVTDRVPGFSIQNASGAWEGFFVDYCRAAAAAVIGDADAVSVDSFWLDALSGRDIDVLHAGTTWTFNRDTSQGIEFPGIYFYDGQGFIANASLGVENVEQALSKQGVKVCAISETSTAFRNLNDFIKRNNAPWEVVEIKTMEGMWRAFFGGRCNMAIHDRSALAAVHAGRMGDTADYIVLPDVITKEPLAPAVRDDDIQWRDLLSWVLQVTIVAEEHSITKDNVDQVRTSAELTEIRYLLGEIEGLGKPFGLDDSWAYRVIKQVGNYGEIFNNNLGPETKFKMTRGMNKLWRDGGLLYAPPLR
ncbi:MAG: transporter substrate-binding domain-containing protein [Magnetovibrio sp.]|nr:transporter substrate-binding domain-containing protein [Magnetovibrio sp.]